MEQVLAAIETVMATGKVATYAIVSIWADGDGGDMAVDSRLDAAARRSGIVAPVRSRRHGLTSLTGAAGAASRVKRGGAMRKETILALVALGLGSLLLAQDLTALNVALPSIERDLNVDLTTAQWVVNAYLLVYGMLIVTGGRLADELGRRRVFLAGAVIFAGMSLLAGFAPSAPWLIAARALMGIGAGLMLPALTGMDYAALPAQRAELAGGVNVGAYGVGMAIGPMIGGALTEFAGWRWIQFVNVPIAALVMFGVWRTIPSDPRGTHPGIDYAGIVTLSAALVSLLFALDQASSWGWGDWRILLSLALAIVFGAIFVARRASCRRRRACAGRYPAHPWCGAALLTAGPDGAGLRRPRPLSAADHAEADGALAVAVWGRHAADAGRLRRRRLPGRLARQADQRSGRDRRRYGRHGDWHISPVAVRCRRRIRRIGGGHGRDGDRPRALPTVLGDRRRGGGQSGPQEPGRGAGARCSSSSAAPSGWA